MLKITKYKKLMKISQQYDLFFSITEHLIENMGKCSKVLNTKIRKKTQQYVFFSSKFRNKFQRVTFLKITIRNLIFLLLFENKICNCYLQKFYVIFTFSSQMHFDL